MDTATIKQAVELRKAHLNLIRYSLDKGHSITVHYGDGDDELTMSRDFALIKDAAEACDESYILIYDHNKKRIGWAWVIFGNEDNELVSDYSATDYMDKWWDQFEEMYEATE